MDLAKAFENELVIVIDKSDEGTLYTHEEYIGAFHEAFERRFAALMPERASQRQIYKALRALRTKASHAATLRDALTRLHRRGTPVNPDQVSDKHRVVAAFPRT